MLEDDDGGLGGSGTCSVCGGGGGSGGGGAGNGGGGTGSGGPTPPASTSGGQYPNGKQCWPRCSRDDETSDNDCNIARCKPPQGDDALPVAVGWEWLTGQGPRHHTFMDTDPFTKLLRQHDHIAQTRAMIAAKFATGDFGPGSNDYDLSGLKGVPKYIGDYSTVLTFGQTGNLAVTYLGSYQLDYRVVGGDLESGEARVLFHASNTTTLASGTRPPVLGYTEFWTQNVSPAINAITQSGPISTTTQDFYWNENITFK